MAARQEIAELLDQWLQLTRAETGAIENGTWPSLREIQTAKVSLQKRLGEAREKWQAENPGKLVAGPVKHPFYAVIGRLLSLETRNAALLAGKLRRAHTKRESLKEAARNLRKVQQSYVLKSAGLLNCSS
jgi:hypothetical protein